MNELLLAIDAGTGSVRAVLFDADGRQVAIGQREYAHAAEPGVPGSQVFDTAANWELACACIAEAIDLAAVDASAIRAVATTSMREGMVLYERRDGNFALRIPLRRASAFSHCSFRPGRTSSVTHKRKSSRSD